MLLRSKYGSMLLPAFLALVLTFIFSCERAERYVGTYVARATEALEPSDIHIELKENGQGVWRVLDDEAPFKWDVKGDEIRLHTKAGGVILGKIQGDTLQIALPGREVRHFKKANEGG
jgi:hypothetical protein